jgi:basic amino acid/polyamine antiporter, APA family
MNANRRDAGLVRAVGPWALTANLINCLVGAGIFAIPAALAACLGVFAPLSFVICGIAIGAVAICFAEGGSRIPTSGGAYGYIEAAFGPLAGFVSGAMLCIGDVLACGGIAAALADAVTGLVPTPAKAGVHAAAIVGVIGGIALLNIGGVKRGAWLVNLATIVKLVPLVVFVLAGAWAIHGANFAPMVKLDTKGLGRAMILALFALTGMEISLSVSGEVKEPSRNIPRALAMALGGVIVLYAAIQLVAQGILGAGLAGSAASLVDAMARVNPALRALMLAGVGVSMFGWISGDILSTPRMVFAFARDGLLPKVLGRVNARSHVPHVAIGCYAAVAMILALTGTFAELAVLAMLVTAVLYIAGCAAAWKLARRGVAEAGAPLNFRWIGTAAVVGIGSMIVMIALASRVELIGLFAMVCASIFVYLVQRRFVRMKNVTEAAAHLRT